MLSAGDSKFNLAVLSQLFSFLNGDGSGWPLTVIQLNTLLRGGHERTGPFRDFHRPCPPSCSAPGFPHLWPWLPFPLLPHFVPVGFTFFLLGGIVRPCTVPKGFGAELPLLSKKNVLGVGSSPGGTWSSEGRGIPGRARRVALQWSWHPSAGPLCLQLRLQAACVLALPFTRPETEATGALSCWCVNLGGEAGTWPRRGGRCGGMQGLPRTRMDWGFFMHSWLSVNWLTPLGGSSFHWLIIFLTLKKRFLCTQYSLVKAENSTHHIYTHTHKIHSALFLIANSPRGTRSPA